MFKAKIDRDLPGGGTLCDYKATMVEYEINAR